MTKTLAFYVALVLCAITIPGVTCAPKKVSISRSLLISAANASTVPFDGHLYTIAKNQSHIHVNSTGSAERSCDIAIDPAKDVFQSHLEVTAKDDAIFVVGVRSVIEADDDPYHIDSKYTYTVLRIDPRNCSYQSIPVPEVNDDPRGYDDFARLVERQSGQTDLFFSNLKNCAPCRLDDIGSSRSAEPAPQLPRDETPGDVVDHEVSFVNSMNAYFYVYRAFNASGGVEATKLKLLDGQDFSTKAERSIDYSVNAISKEKKSSGYLGVCTKKREGRLIDITAYTEVRCDRLDSTLETTNSIAIPMGSDAQRVSRISYEFDDEGNSYVGFAIDTELWLYIHDKDGRLLKAVDMGKVDGAFEEYPDVNPTAFDPYIYWDVSGFLVGDEYCVRSGQSVFYYKTPLHEVRCVDVKRYVKH